MIVPGTIVLAAPNSGSMPVASYVVLSVLDGSYELVPLEGGVFSAVIHTVTESHEGAYGWRFLATIENNLKVVELIDSLTAVMNTPLVGLTDQGKQGILLVRNYLVDVIEPRIIQEKEQNHAKHDAALAEQRAQSLETMRQMFQRLRDNDNTPTQEYEGLGSEEDSSEIFSFGEAEGQSPESQEDGYEITDPDGRFYIAIDGNDSEYIARLHERIRQIIAEDLGQGGL